MKTRSLVKMSGKEPVKVEPLAKVATLPKAVKASLASPNAFKAAVVTGKTGAPRYFVFDTPSLWDLLCVIDAKFEETASTEEYVLRNPVGWLIDAIEAHLPLQPTLVAKLKRGLDEAVTRGTVSFEQVKRNLGLS
mgnify:CR=1 FL=1